MDDDGADLDGHGGPFGGLRAGHRPYGRGGRSPHGGRGGRGGALPVHAGYALPVERHSGGHAPCRTVRRADPAAAAGAATAVPRFCRRRRRHGGGIGQSVGQSAGAGQCRHGTRHGGRAAYGTAHPRRGKRQSLSACGVLHGLGAASAHHGGCGALGSRVPNTL